MARQNRTFIKSWIGLLLATFSLQTAKASFEFSPITSNLTTDGKSSSMLAKLVNKQTAELPIVITILERTMGENGEEIRTPTSDLEVYPRHFILGPKEEKLVKVIWKGAKDLPYEKAFRLLVEHVPVELSPTSVGIGSLKIMINYSAMVYVSSRPGNPEVTLSSVEKTSSARKLAISLENKGDVHSIISKPEIGLQCDTPNAVKASQEIILKNKTLANAEGKNLLAKSKLRTSINIPASLENCPKFKWSFRYSVQ